MGPEVKPKMLSVPGSDRDPLRAFHLYAAKRPEQMNSEDSPFYLAVDLTKMANSLKPWLKAMPVGVKKLKSLVKTMAQKAGLNDENLTNHNGRKQMIQKLNDQEVPPTHIMQISGHKNVQSLNNYSSLSEKQQQSISNILNTTTSTRRTLTVEEREDVSLSPQQILSLLPGANIHRGTFNISINTVSQQSPNLSMHSVKRRRYVIESDSD